jgi:hypothetical protein
LDIQKVVCIFASEMVGEPTDIKKKTMNKTNEIKPQTNKVGAQEEGKSLKVNEVVLTNRDHDVRVMIRPTRLFMETSIPKHFVLGCMPGCNKVEFSDQFKDIIANIKEVWANRQQSGIASTFTRIGEYYTIQFDWTEYGEEDEIEMRLTDSAGELVFSVSKTSEDPDDLDIDELIFAWMTVRPVLEDALISTKADDIYEWIKGAGSN